MLPSEITFRVGQNFEHLEQRCTLCTLVEFSPLKKYHFSYTYTRIEDLQVNMCTDHTPTIFIKMAALPR